MRLGLLGLACMFSCSVYGSEKTTDDRVLENLTETVKTVYRLISTTRDYNELQSKLDKALDDSLEELSANFKEALRQRRGEISGLLYTTHKIIHQKLVMQK